MHLVPVVHVYGMKNRCLFLWNSSKISEEMMNESQSLKDDVLGSRHDDRHS